MRILHTADWHLGRLFYNNRLTEDQAYVLEHQWKHILKEEHIDAVVIAGDVFDRSVPAVEAVELWDKILYELAFDYKIPTVVIGGNHDNGTRLAVGHHFYKEHGVYVVGTTTQGSQPIWIDDKDGAVAFCPLAYEEPTRIWSDFGTEDVVPDFSLANEAWANHLLGQVPSGKRSVALAHAFVAGGQPSDSERPLRVGGKEQVSPHVYEGFHYTALGHLHGPQQAGAPHIRYSGSLLPYSFDEATQKKSFTIVDMDAQGQVSLSYIPVEVPHAVRIITGTFTALLEDRTLQDSHQSAYVLARLTDTAPVLDGFSRLRQVYPHLLSLELVGRVRPTNTNVEGPRFQGLNERDLFNHLAQAAWGEGLDEKQQAYMDALWDRVHKEEL